MGFRSTKILCIYACPTFQGYQTNLLDFLKNMASIWADSYRGMAWM
jgi:hypothetical protein